MLHYFAANRSLFRKFGTLVVACVCLIVLLLFANRTWADENMPDAPGSIAGVVTNAATTLPVAGIEIAVLQQVYSGGWQQIRVLSTDANGTYKANLLGAGIYRILASDPKGVLAQTYYAGATVLEAATDVPVAGVTVTGINLQLALGGGITGTITRTLTTSTAEENIVLRIFQKIGTKWGNVRAVALVTTQKEYSLTGLPAGVYRLCISNAYPLNTYDPNQDCYANAYAIDNGIDVTVTAAAITPNINFILGDGADLGKIVGNVAAVDGKPLSKASVTANRITTDAYDSINWSQSTQTNRDGSYQLLGLLPGSYAVSFFSADDNYVSEVYSNVQFLTYISTAQVTPVTVARKETHTGINATLVPASYVSGVLTLDGAPIQQSAFLAIYRKDQGRSEAYYSYTDVDPRTGRYTIGRLPAGVYQIMAVTDVGSSDYQGFYGGTAIENATLITLTAGETRTDLDIELTQTSASIPYSAQISGTVTADGAPVSGVKVALYQTNCCPAFPPLDTPSQPSPSPTATPDQSTSHVAQAASANQSSSPASTATTADIKPLIYTYTDAKGYYRIDGLLNGNYYLGVSDPTGVYATTYYSDHLLLQNATAFFLQGQTAVSPNGMDDISTNVELVKGGGISGRVHLKDGTGVVNLAVGVFVQDQTYSWTLVTEDDRTDADGNFTVKGLQAGTYHLCFGDPTGNYAIECYGAGNPYNGPELGANIAVLPSKITSNIDHQLGQKKNTFLPLIQQNTP